MLVYFALLFSVIAFPGRQPHFETICKDGAKLKSGGQLSSKTIGHRISTLQDRWRKLGETTASRKTRLKEAAQAQQVCTTKPVDANADRVLLIMFCFASLPAY